jgi:predicted CXXCH cytochrome family protein
MKPNLIVTNKTEKNLNIPWRTLIALGLWLYWAPVGIAQDSECIECHKETVQKEHVHGPTATSCIACHEANGEKHPQDGVAGFALFAEDAELCYSCHTESREEFDVRYKHKPIKDNQCLECHDVHSSDNAQFLVNNDTPSLCFTCHDDYQKNIETATTVHTASIEGEDSCLKCHNPHASKTRRLLVDVNRDLCLSCHNEIVEKGERKLANIEKLLNDNSHDHPALKKSCTSCHSPHYSERERLFKENYPLGNYAKGLEENYTLCFNCHDTDIINIEKTETATLFREGDRNLHYEHLNKDKGRSCMNCHDVHAANNTKLVATTIRFGRWDMPLNFLEKENGGTCATGCHKERSYNNGTSDTGDTSIEN